MRGPTLDPEGAREAVRRAVVASKRVAWGIARLDERALFHVALAIWLVALSVASVPPTAVRIMVPIDARAASCASSRCGAGNHACGTDTGMPATRTCMRCFSVGDSFLFDGGKFDPPPPLPLRGQVRDAFVPSPRSLTARPPVPPPEPV